MDSKREALELVAARWELEEEELEPIIAAALDKCEKIKILNEVRFHCNHCAPCRLARGLASRWAFVGILRSRLELALRG